MNPPNALRVAFVAGTLGQGGAEKQLTYMVRALLQSGALVRVYTLAPGEHYESTLQDLGADVLWIGKFSNPVGRLVSLTASLRKFEPHLVQSSHFFANLYAGLAAPLVGAVGIGAIRNDMTREMESNPFWGKLLLSRVGSLIANSQEAQRNAHKLGIAVGRVSWLPNVIDLAEFDKQSQKGPINPLGPAPVPGIVVASVGRLVTAKRFDRFMDVLALARQKSPQLSGLIIGDGPEKANLLAYASQKGLSGSHLSFLGRRDDVPAILKQVQMFALTSDHEGFPNVLLEAMAARLPVITTPAGDSGVVVRHGLTGYVRPYEDVNGLAECMVDLTKSQALRDAFGAEGRKRVEEHYGTEGLSASLLSIYKQAAARSRSRRIIEALRSI